jgi:peptidyl-prolyl cis-trans isomerase SurA
MKTYNKRVCTPSRRDGHVLNRECNIFSSSKELKPKVHRSARYTSIVVIALTVALGAACNRAGGAASGGDVAATVNGKNIMMSEVDTILSQQANGQQSKMSPLELAAARMQVLDELVKQEILFQRAEKEKLLPNEDDVTAAISQKKQQNGMTEEEYQKYLKSSGQTDQGVRESARKQLAVQKLLDKVAGQIKISDKEVQDFFDNNRQRYVAQRGVGLAAIVVDPADNGLQDDAKGDAEAKLKIDGVYARLKQGADFATVAREKSEDPNSNVRGGDIGFATEDQLKQNGFPQETVSQFFGPMQNGDITAPVHFPTGQWYIFKLTDKRLQSENLTLDSPDVRKDITDALLNQRRQVLSAALLQVAMNDSKISNNLATKMLESPQNFGTLRPAGAAASTAPADAASPAAASSPAAQTAASPKAAASPAGSPAAKKK